MFLEYVSRVLEYLDVIQQFFWSYIAFAIICLVGLYLTIISRGLQFRTLFTLRKTIKEIIQQGKVANKGISPLKLFFTSAGGSVGMGNIVGITMAVMIGGLGSIFWIWIASIAGMLLKYSEIYLGVKYRVHNEKGGYDGGPMYYLQAAFKSKIPAYLSAILLCLYGVDVYQFVVLVDRLEYEFVFDRWSIIAFLLILIIYADASY